MSPGGDSATSKLVNSRCSRKKAEEDVKLLANRIQLLKMEEKKVLSNYRCLNLNLVGMEENRRNKKEGN